MRNYQKGKGTAKQRAVLEFLRSSPGKAFTRVEIAKETGISRSLMIYLLRKLIDEDKVDYSANYKDGTDLGVGGGRPARKYWAVDCKEWEIKEVNDK